MRTSCASWLSLDVIYTQPPQDSVLTRPDRKTTVGRDEVGDRVRIYCKTTSAIRGPKKAACQPLHGLRIARLTGCKSDEYLENISFWVPIPDARIIVCLSSSPRKIWRTPQRLKATTHQATVLHHCARLFCSVINRQEPKQRWKRWKLKQYGQLRCKKH